MDDIIDLIALNSSANNISNAIKSSLYAKSAERIDSLRPSVANSIFSSSENTDLGDE